MNVQSALRIGEEMMTKFESFFEEIFFNFFQSNHYSWRGKPEVLKKDFVKLDTGIILTRVLYHLERDVELKQIFHYELDPMPTSLFKTKFEANYQQNNSTES